MSDLVARFPPARRTYIREHVMLAALGSVLVTAFLAVTGNPHLWVGPVAAVLAIALRGIYAMSEQLGMVWELTEHSLIAPDKSKLPLSTVANARAIFSAVQIITRSGEKHLIKYQPAPAEAAALILRTRDGDKA